MKVKISSFWLIALSMVLIKLIIHFLTGSIYELHRDEMLYFAEGEHLSFGYMSTPPFVGFLAFLVRIIFGYSQFGIKLFPALAGAASILIIALFVKEFGGKNLALLIAGTGYIAAGAFLRGNSLFMPVCFDQFFWLLSSYLIFRMVKTNNPKLWLWIGFVFGLAFLNKYAIVFFAFALIVALLMSKHRKLIDSKYALYGAIIGFLIILPNLYWQYIYNWPVIRHMAELQRTQLVNVTASNYLSEQIMMCFSSVIIWVAGLALLFIPKEKNYRFIAWTFILTIGIILLGRGKPYYTLGAYPMLYVAGGYILEKYLTRKWRYVTYTILFFTIIVSVLTSPLALPYASFATVKRYCDPKTGIAPQRWEDGKIYPIPQDYADMTGWKELAGIVSKAYNRLDEQEKRKCTIYAENYGEAGAVQFYGHRYGLPEPICFNDSYLLWAPDTISDGPFICINNQIGDIDYLFNDYEEIGCVNNEYFRENGITVWLCTHPKEQWKKFYAQKVHMLKNSFSKQDGCKNAIAIRVPAVIQAEDCCNSVGIETEITSDSSGWSNVGWIDNGDWMEYKIDIPVNGTYFLTLRVASLSGGGSVTISCKGNSLNTVVIPATGGWQNWTTVDTSVRLEAGIQIIRFAAVTGGWNINWFRISLGST